MTGHCYVSPRSSAVTLCSKSSSARWFVASSAMTSAHGSAFLPLGVARVLVATGSARFAQRVARERLTMRPIIVSAHGVNANLSTGSPQVACNERCAQQIPGL